MIDAIYYLTRQVDRMGRIRGEARYLGERYQRKRCGGGRELNPGSPQREGSKSTLDQSVSRATGGVNKTGRDDMNSSVHNGK